MARYKVPTGVQVRLDWGDVMKRKVSAIRAEAMKPSMPRRAVVAMVFNAAEIKTLQRMAKGERVGGVNLTKEEVANQLQWINLGGRYPDEDYGDDEDA